MKKFLTPILFGMVLGMAFHDTADFLPGYFDVFFGDFEFLPSSLDSIPFQNETKAIFLDSFHHEVVFTISSEFIPNELDGFISASSTTTEYCYITDRLKYTFINDSLNISLDIEIMAFPHPLHPVKEGSIADMLFISAHLIRSDSIVRVVPIFTKILNQRTSEGPFIKNGIYTTYEIYGKTFSNVEYRLNTQQFPIPSIHFNIFEGIVSFLDWTGKRWRFDQFE